MGNRPSKSRETVAELRKQSSDIKIRARALKKLADEERNMAKELLRDGNQEGARKALIRRKRYQKDLNSLHSKAAMVSRVIEAIAKAEQNDKLLKVLSASKTVLDTTASEERMTQAEEVMTGLEMSLENVDALEERFEETSILDDPLDLELADIGSEMDVLMSEIEQESGQRKPAPAQTTPSTTAPQRRRRTVLQDTDEFAPIPSSTPDSSGGAESEEDQKLRDEIARIRQELGEELG